MKYAIYCRKSTDTEDKQVLSLESQEHELKALAKAQGLHITQTLYESRSAKAPGRPVFDELMYRIELGEIDAILCWKIDRLTRNPVDGGKIQWLLQQGKIKCITTFEKNYYPNDNVLLMSIEQAMANQYIRDLSVNVKRGNRAKRERGEWPNRAPWGYLNDKATKTVVVNKKLAPYIVRMFTLYSLGKNFKEISEILYQEGLRNTAGNKVFKSTIQRIIINPFYCGLIVYDDKIYQGKHKPLISKAQFDKCKDIATNKTRPKKINLFFPLRGFLVCENCGCNLTASLKKGHHYYYCTNGKGICDQHTSYMREKDVYDIVAKILGSLHFSEQKIELMYQAAKIMLEDETKYLENSLRNLQESLEAISRKETKLFDAYSDDSISRDLYKTKTLALQNERISIQNQINNLKTKEPFNTLEPVKSIFLQASKAQKEFIYAGDAQKKEIIEKLLWNLSIKDKKVLSVKYKSPFEIIAKAPKNAKISEMLPD